MYRILFVFMMSYLCLSCKTISSNTMDILNEDNGKYYYAWTGEKKEDGKSREVLCMGICNRRPVSMEEALTSVCNNGVKYFRAVLAGSSGVDTLYIVDVDTDISYLYGLTEESTDVSEVCLSESIIAQRSQSRDVPEISPDYWYPRVYTKPAPSELEMSEKDYNEYNSKYRISQFLTVYSKESKNVYQPPTAGPTQYKESDFSYLIVVKPIKLGLSYDEAKVYCSTPEETVKKYIKNWNKVELGGDKASIHIPAWATDSSKNPKVSKDSKDIYTVCVTDEDNLQDAYIYKLKIIHPPVTVPEG